MNISEEVKRRCSTRSGWTPSATTTRTSRSPPNLTRMFSRSSATRHVLRRGRERATEMESWQKDVLDILRTESYYFAAQKMTKVMNEGWAAYWESLMMGEERFAGTDEFLTYADHQSRVLGSPGLNPYSLGLEIWEYVENTENRREVIERLLRVKGITWRNFDDSVDYEMVQGRLEPPAWLTDIPGHLDDLDPEDARSAPTTGIGPRRRVDVEHVHRCLIRVAGPAALLAGPTPVPRLRLPGRARGTRTPLPVHVRQRGVRNRRGSHR